MLLAKWSGGPGYDPVKKRAKTDDVEGGGVQGHTLFQQ